MPRWLAAGFAVGVTMTLHTAWELVEYALEEWLDANPNVSYGDTIADSALALAGAVLGAAAATLVTGAARSRMR